MIALVHLVWAPLGPVPLRRFLRSLERHPPGAEHELVIVLNGAQAAGRDRDVLLAELERTAHRLISLERPMLDLAAYGAAVPMLQHELVCFLNSYSVILADDWLGLLAGALAAPDVGLAGATGSWESQAEWRRGDLTRWPQQLAGMAGARRDYPRFPNPHVRTSGFMIERSRLVDAGMSRAGDKRATYLLESGHESITRRVQRDGLRAVVVGRDAIAYDAEGWPGSHTFRSGAQENLLVADNQTLDYETASPRRRRRLTRDTWGRLGAGVQQRARAG